MPRTKIESGGCSARNTMWLRRCATHRASMMSSTRAIAEGMLRGVRTVPVDGAALERSSRLLPLEVRSLDAIQLPAAPRRRRARSTNSTLPSTRNR
jgi:hypothetical protein